MSRSGPPCVRWGLRPHDEAEPEDGVDTLLVEDGHEVVDVADLLALVAHEAGLECDAVRLHGHVPPCAAVVASPAERAAADLQDRHGLAVGELPAQVLAVGGGVAQTAEGVEAHDVERAPVHAVQGLEA